MATAIAVVRAIGADATGPFIELEVLISGVEVPGGYEFTYPYVYINPATDTAVAIENKISAAVVAEGTTRGYNLSSNSVIVPSFQKG